MKTYIVPVDFSATSVHAAEYAVMLSHQTDVTHIILLHSYYISVYQSVLPTPDMVIISEDEIETETDEKLAELRHLRRKLLRTVRDGVEIDVKVSRSTLTRSVIESISDENASLIILGSNGINSDNNSHVGVNAINISKLSPVPVVVVPPACCYEPVKRVVMACDFLKVTEAFPLEPLQKLLIRHDVELLVVNIDKQAKHRNADLQQMAEESALHKMLKEYHPKYYYNESGDVINGILDFAKKHHAEMVIALPHKYSFLQSLLHNSVSAGLTVHSAMPVLLLK
ncbi:MAG TPA: universal stress protein [Mucilaginibacter sp.]|jgi:nucleotide-binding universal stress UspA family protein|nr:universal stress protein [Mucilaginibacter sp.]